MGMAVLAFSLSSLAIGFILGLLVRLIFNGGINIRRARGIRKIWFEVADGISIIIILFAEFVALKYYYSLHPGFDFLIYLYASLILTGAALISAPLISNPIVVKYRGKKP